jgi:predicted PurR-regulated permease PerM
MIQLIGLLICAYVFVRGLDIWSRLEDRKSGTSRVLAIFAVLIAIVAAIVFAVAFIQQGNEVPNIPSTLPY